MALLGVAVALGAVAAVAAVLVQVTMGAFSSGRERR